MTNFANKERIIEGWYWALRSKSLKPGRARGVRMLGRDFAFYRTEQGEAVALDAYCPHMGAHLAEGRVEGDSIRCLFHRWKFNREGDCSEVPYFGGRPPFRACARAWKIREAYGLIWLWTGDSDPGPFPIPAELENVGLEARLGGSFIKNCHPHVVLVNAIDEHHFNGVHNLPVRLWMQSHVLDDNAISFANQTRLGNETWLRRFLSRFYAGPLTYQLTYWYGTTGAVTLGPDFQHFYIAFALRPTEDGRAEGQTLLFTRQRPGIVGWAHSRLLLGLTALVGAYFAHGDTKIFRSIQFALKTPIKADHAILDFIRHIDRQKTVEWDKKNILVREILHV